MENIYYQSTLFVEYLRQYLTLVFVKIFPNVLQSLQKNLENSWTQAVDATLILPTISISCGSLKMRKQKDINHYSDLLVYLQLYLYRFTVYNTYIRAALLVLIKLSTCSVQLLTLEESKGLSARKVRPTFSNICYYRAVYFMKYSEYNNLHFNIELTTLVQRCKR